MSYFLVEGCDGVGKSTTAVLLTQELEGRGHLVYRTKEPGSPDDPVCVQIRQILLNPKNIIADRAALLLFLADRAQHIELIKKKMAEGYIVISDRGSLSSLVYHTAVSGKGMPEVAEEIGPLLDFAQQIQPDICFLCSADLKWATEQLQRRTQLDRIEQFDADFHKKTHSLFATTDWSQVSKHFKTIPKYIVALPAADQNSPEAIVDYAIDHLDLFKLI